MLKRDPDSLKRLQAVVSALIERSVASSLASVELALTRWRSEGHGALASAHGAVLRHVACCERIVARIMAVVDDRPEGLLRDAVDAGLMSEEEFVGLVGKSSRDFEGATGIPDKRRTLEALLSRGAVLVHLDTRGSEVLVPPRFRVASSLVLRFGYNLTPAIADLTVDERGITGTLAFSGQLFHCVVPWAAVYAMVGEGESHGMVWPEDIPEDVLIGSKQQAVSAASPLSSTAVSRLDEESCKRGHLKLV